MLQHETWPIGKLIEYARNPRKNDHAVDRVAAAIREFGFRVPVVAKSDGTVVDGHLRLKAAKKLGLTEVPVVLADDMTDLQIKAFRLSVNKMAELAEWDDELLAIEFAELADAGFDNLLTGFTQDEIDALTPEQIPEGLTDEDAVPEVQAEPVSKLGDVWVMGKHRVVCGDATSADDWAKLEIIRPAMVFSSPPYGVGENAKLRDKYVKGAAQRKTLYATHTDSPDEWPDLMRGWTNLALAETDCVVCNIQTLANNKRNLIAWSAEYVDHVCDIAIWDKGHGAPQMQANVLTNVFEWLFILTPETGASRAIPLSDFHGTETNMVRIGKGQREYSNVHAATMPVDLATWACKSIGPKAKSIVDPFGGTGTTLIAAEMAGKPARLIEIDPKYVDVIVRRWQEFTGKQATHEATGATFAEVEADSALAVAEDV